ncbi:hypothetical protein FKM82_017719 [Ascaphus truei]
MIPEDDQIFTEVELNTLEKLISDSWTWKNETLAEQAKLPPTEKPALLSKDIEQKLSALDREVQYLLNKAKFSKPKPKKKSNSTKTEAEKNSTDSGEKVIPPLSEESVGGERTLTSLAASGFCTLLVVLCVASAVGLCGISHGSGWYQPWVHTSLPHTSLPHTSLPHPALTNRIKEIYARSHLRR